MSETKCPRCERTLNVESGAAFCPYCGAPIAQAETKPESEAVLALLNKLESMSDPAKKSKLLLQAQAEHPDSLAIAEELLFLGRLSERDPHTLDFSVINSYLLMIYLEPSAVSPEKVEEMRRELFDHPQLARCLALAPDPTAFLNHYLVRLSGHFIDLFLRGSSKYMRRVFGFGLDSRAPKLLASPAAHMLASIRDDSGLTAEQRAMLMRALYTAFSNNLGGDTQWLRKEMADRGVVLP